jgi:hypothetical protein
MLYQLSYASAKIIHDKIFRLRKARMFSHPICEALQFDAKLGFEIRFSSQVLTLLKIKFSHALALDNIIPQPAFRWSLF